MIERKQRRGFGSFEDIEISLLDGTIISSLFPEIKEITIQDIIKRTEYSYERVNSSLKYLTDKEIVNEKKVGKTLVYSLNLQNINAKEGFNQYMLEREIEFKKKNGTIYLAIQEIKNNPFIWLLILFGSYSKGTETKQSDIDIICVSHNKKEAEYFIKSLKYNYNIDFASIVLSPNDFPNIKKDNPELWVNLKMYGLVFKGEEEFYYQMYKDEKQN